MLLLLLLQASLRSGSRKYELVPIDHGFCLPETLEAPYFEWLHWPQVRAPYVRSNAGPGQGRAGLHA